MSKTTRIGSWITKTFTKTDWSAMYLIAEPTAKRGAIRQDGDGIAWEWVAGGKRVTGKVAHDAPAADLLGEHHGRNY